jgi:hypothetical protein
MRSVFIAVACGLIGFGCVSVALADPPVLPPDPLVDPAAAFDGFRALYKIGWPVTVIAGVAVLARLLGRFVPRFAMLAGKPAAVIAVVAACAAAAFDVLALGGSWASVVMAAFTSLLTLWQPTPVKADDKGGGN